MKLLAVSLLLIEALAASCAQSPPSGTSPQIEPRITKLPPPSYPPMAMAARVSGPVELSITLRPDGTVDSAEVVSGPPMLKAAAIESAREMQFDCNGCTVGATQFHLSFSYEFNWDYSCDAPDKSYPRVSEANGAVTFTGQPPSTCDPSASVSRIRVRAAKCLYLWPCGRRIVTP